MFFNRSQKGCCSKTQHSECVQSLRTCAYTPNLILESAQPRIISGNHRQVANIDSTKGITAVTIGETVRIIKGASVKLKCKATGVPTPDIVWTLNRKPIVDDNLILQTYDELLILDFDEKHTGDYKCVAKNIIGQARAWSDVRMVGK